MTPSFLHSLTGGVYIYQLFTIAKGMNGILDIFHILYTRSCQSFFIIKCLTENLIDILIAVSCK